MATRPFWAVRCLTTSGKKAAAGGAGSKDEPPKFGKSVADDAAPAQMMHDVTKGKFAYIGDFVQSLDKGPVKLDFGKKEVVKSEKQQKIDELNERNLQMIKRSLIMGSVLAGMACAIGWQVTKWVYGVKSIAEFGEVMQQRMPKVSGSLEDSAVGRTLKEASESSKESISESETITDWRRFVRAKFNSPEGAKIAREYSMVMADKREAEKALRKSRKPVGSVTAAKRQTEDTAQDKAVAAELSAIMKEGATDAESNGSSGDGSLREASSVSVSGGASDGGGGGGVSSSGASSTGMGDASHSGSGSELPVPRLVRTTSARVYAAAKELVVGKPKAPPASAEREGAEPV